MDSVRCELIRWVSDDPQQGWVEARLVDAEGVERSFLDKPVIFTVDRVSPTSSFPIPAMIRCEVLGIRHDGQGGEVLDVQLADGVESVEGTSRLRVRREQIVTG
jgi:hypothetical protein